MSTVAREEPEQIQQTGTPNRWKASSAPTPRGRSLPCRVTSGGEHAGPRGAEVLWEQLHDNGLRQLVGALTGPGVRGSVRPQAST